MQYYASMNLVSGELVADYILQLHLLSRKKHAFTHTGSKYLPKQIDVCSLSKYSILAREKLLCLQFGAAIACLCLLKTKYTQSYLRFVHSICFHHECKMHTYVSIFLLYLHFKSKVSLPMHFHFVGQGKFVNTSEEKTIVRIYFVCILTNIL